VDEDLHDLFASSRAEGFVETGRGMEEKDAFGKRYSR
jgi:hypothetical protein